MAPRTGADFFYNARDGEYLYRLLPMQQVSSRSIIILNNSLLLQASIINNSAAMVKSPVTSQ